MMKIGRIFISKTSLTPDDEHAIINRGPELFDDYDEVHISVTFTWDIARAEKLADSWSKVTNVKIGGPATGMKGEQFEPGVFLKNGCVITSRGCPNRCWFCSVWKRDGNVRELEIRNGVEICDDNILACSEEHVRRVFAMINKNSCLGQPLFTGGLEARRLKNWHVELFETMKKRPNTLYFAYDTENDFDPLAEAGRMFKDTYWGNSNMAKLRCYLLCAFPKDSILKAEKRATQCVRAGFLPFIMIYRNEKGKYSFDDMKEWKTFANQWNFPKIVLPKLRTYGIVDEKFRLINNRTTPIN